MFWQRCKEYQYAIWFYMLLFCYFNFVIFKLYGFSIFPDEYSYWAYAAKMAGYDWSEITALGSFYAWGYSLILFPIFLICPNSLIAYRAAVALNFIMLGLAYIIIVNILKHIGFGNNADNQIYAAAAIFYPPVVFYAHTTMAETLLAVVYLMLIVWLIKYLKAPSFANLMLLCITGIYMYLVHMRTIGILQGLIFLLIYAELRYRKNFKRAAAILALSITAMLAVHIVKGQMASLFYPNVGTDLYEINTLEGQIEKIRYIFSYKGFAAFLNEICGSFLYIGISGFGIAFWGIFCLVKRCGWQSESNCIFPVASVVCAFVLISALSQVIINAVYNVIPDSYDSLTYGRYQDYVMPVLIAAGMGEILQNGKGIIKYLLATGAAMLILTMIVYRYCISLKLNPMKGYFMAGMSFFRLKEFNPKSFYAMSCAIGISIMFICGVLAVIQIRSGLKWIFMTVVIIQLLILAQLGKMYLYPFNLLARQDIEIAQRIERLIQDCEDDRRIIYVDYNEISAVGLLQFMLRDTEIKVYKEQTQTLKEHLDEKSVVVLGANDPIQAQLENKYKTEVINGHFVLFYN